MIIDLLMESVCSESHQISVKFFVQWLLIRLLCDEKESLGMIVSKVMATDKAQPSTIIAFIPILYHLASRRNTAEFWNSVLELMLSWTMGPHFNLRLHSQVLRVDELYFL